MSDKPIVISKKDYVFIQAIIMAGVVASEGGFHNLKSNVDHLVERLLEKLDVVVEDAPKKKDFPEIFGEFIEELTK